MIYVLGSRGRLGRAICASRPSEEVVALDRQVYADWWRANAGASIERFFEKAEPGSSVLIAAGLLDPALPNSEHRRINVQLPVRIMDAATAVGLRVVTFGTVMERLGVHSNPYVASKAELGHLVAERSELGRAVVHLQLHTLYGGGMPAPFMFVGQICAALREGRPFEMSPGRQLREYHHVQDDVDAMHIICTAKTTGVVALSHGEPVTLRALATGIFSAMERTDLLRIGARGEPPDDNYATVMAPPPVLANFRFRPALQGVVTYVREVLANSAD